MGYYTRFELEVNTGPHTISEIALAIFNSKDYMSVVFEIPEDYLLIDTSSHSNFHLDSDDIAKWYSEKEDMLRFSKCFPSATFTVYGEGEEQGDVWEHEYKNGKMRERRQVYMWSNWSDWTTCQNE